MQAAPTRYVSVSELYSTDEVELLLDEIRELEPTSCRGEDLQDFEIAGSGCSGAGGGRSPAGTELTERSWDSHAHYRRAPPARPRPLAPLYCRPAHLLTWRGAGSLLLVLICACVCGCVWGAVGLRVALLPLAARVQLLLLGALSSLLLHGVLLAMQLTGLAWLLPINWNKLSGATSVWSALSLGAGALLSLHAVLAAREYRWAPPATARPLLAAAGLGLAAAGLAVALCAINVPRPPPAYRAVPTQRADTSQDHPL